MKFLKKDTNESKALHQAFLRFLPILVVLVIASSFVISYENFNSRIHNITHEQQHEIVSAMIVYRNEISQLTAIVRAIEADYLELAVRNAADTDVEALFMTNMREYPVIDKLRILDLNGMEILRLNQNYGDPYVVAPEDLQDKSDRYFYQEARVLGRHQFLFSALDLNVENGTVEFNPETGLAKPTLRITSPLDIDEQRIGYLAVNFLMRDTLNGIRTYMNETGCYILMFDENGYLYNDVNDDNNFGFCFAEGAVQYGRTIDDFFPGIDLTVDSNSFIQNNKICSYTLFSNIYDRSKDYFLAETAAKKLGFLLYYDSTSAYANDLHYSFFYHFVTSWKIQLLVDAGWILLYLLMIHLVFAYDPIRFTEVFTDQRYAKSTLRMALRNHEFVNYYQPIINIQDGTLLGVEALSRWKHQGQILPPSMFMDELQHYQLGQKLDENGFMIVRRDRKRFMHYPNCQNMFISINCCQQTFNSLINQPPTTLIRLTEEEKKYIVLELLEDIVFNKRTQERIRDLYKHNILFAIDDFGTGNSNVAFIRSFENLKVKIDRAFVPVDTNDSKERVIIEAFVKMFVDQGLKLIVEGVETKEQIQYLRKLGIAGVQGFYFSHPMNIDQLIDFIEKQEYLDKL